MKYLLLITLLLFTVNTGATPHGHTKPKGSTSQAQSGAASAAISGAYSGGGDSVSDSTSGITDDSVTNMINNYSEAANTSAALVLPECGYGSSAQNKDGGFAIGGMSQICKDATAIRLKLSSIQGEIERAKTLRDMARECPDKPEVQAKHYKEANSIMEGVKEDYAAIQDATDDVLASAAKTRGTATLGDNIMNVLKWVGVVIFSVAILSN